MALRHIGVLATALLVVGPTGLARAQPPCTAEQGQVLIDQGNYKQAVKEFTCVIDAQPTEVDGYRGRIEAQLLLGLYSDALRNYGRVTAHVLPVHPDGASTILAGYDARLSAEPGNIAALTGASFAHWWLFSYAQATHLLNQLLAEHPNDVYGNLFRGSSRLLRGATNAGVVDLERAIALAPENPNVHFIAADAYTYGLFDPQRAFAEATLALNGGLDTPRVHAILASSYLAFGNLPAAVAHIARHFELVTTELVPAPAILPGESLTVSLAPGRTVEIPVPASAGETIAVATSSHDYWDTIALLLAPDGTPVAGSDDANQYFAAFSWPAAETATYRLRVTFFEAVNSGLLLVKRK
jgi:tetratricopeptide (TPR) repeat protein